MQSARRTRREALVLLAGGAAAIALRAAAESPIDIEWSDLVPEGEGETMARLRQLGIVQHGELSTPFEQQTDVELTQEYDGKTVRLPGYVVPLDFDGLGVRSFLLVPFIGACIHVPPPPPNQLVFVTTETPYEVRGLFEPVVVTGVFGSAATATQLAEVGYSMVADRIEPYG